MGSEHPQFDSGQRELSAAQMNAMSRDAELAGKSRMLGGNLKRFAGVGESVNVQTPSLRDDELWDSSATVIIRKSPSSEAGWVKVQRVKYANNPPQPCTATGCQIFAYGIELDVRPAFGQQDDSYKSAEVAAGAAIDKGTSFFRIRLENGIWILDPFAKGGGESGLCLVHKPYTGDQWLDTSVFIRVVHMKPLPPPSTSFVTAESTVPLPDGSIAPGYSVVRCWPGTTAAFWQYLQSTTGSQPNYTAQPNGVYCGTLTINGTEYIAPVFPINMFAPNPALPGGDC